MNKVVLREHEMNAVAKESYKTLRSNIEFSGSNVKVIALTSVAPNEGKSTTSLELAKTFAEKGKKTLLIDADLRKSVMKAEIVEGQAENGLTNCLAGQCKPSEALYETNTPNLYIMFAGPVPPNPSELLDSPLFDRILAAACNSMDMVIIDTPPVGSVIDAAIIAKKTDGAILVVRANSIRYTYAEKAKEQILAAGAKLLGVVLNQVPHKGHGYYGKGYYGKGYYGKGYYGYYTSDNEKKKQKR